MKRIEASEPDMELYQQAQNFFPREFPENCRPCFRIQMAVRWAAEEVAFGEKTLENALTDIRAQAEDVKRNCRYGQTAVGGCFGDSTCNYGVICKFPGPSSSLEL